MPAALHRESHRPVEPGQLLLPQPLGLTFAQANPNHAFAVLDLIIEGNRVASKMHTRRELLQRLSDLVVHQLSGIERNPGTLEIVPAADSRELGPDPASQSLR